MLLDIIVPKEYNYDKDEFDILHFDALKGFV
jgi:hypothetical protein